MAAASSTASHTCMASSTARLASCRGGGSFTAASFVRLPRRQQLAAASPVRCQAEKGPTSTPEQQPAMPSTPPPSPAPKVSTKFRDLLAFGGPAPERINGRLAMVGFVSAVAVELATGNDLAQQLSAGGVPWFLYATALLSVASLVPLFQGVTAESKSGGFMSSTAEIWNGRAAMLGLVGLAFTEYLKGGPLV